MTDAEDITLETELVPEDAEREIVKAASARHSIARKYVMRARRRNPDATPAEIIQVLERQYATAITTAGALISAAAIAMDVGIAMIPVAGAATAGMKSAGQQAAKRTGEGRRQNRDQKHWFDGRKRRSTTRFWFLAGRR